MGEGPGSILSSFKMHVNVHQSKPRKVMRIVNHSIYLQNGMSYFEQILMLYTYTSLHATKIHLDALEAESDFMREKIT